MISGDILRVGYYYLQRAKESKYALLLEHACQVLCRKIYASRLRQSDIESEVIDMFSRRVGKNIFLRNYYRPSLEYYKSKVLDALSKLKKN